MLALTNNHCATNHKMSKKEMIQRHGAPKFVYPTVSGDVQRWIRESQVMITRVDFEVAQASARSQLKRGS